MDIDKIAESVANAIHGRIAATPDDYYISDSGERLWALLAGEYLWSMPAPAGENFHAMTEAKIAMLIHDELAKKFE